MLEKTNKVTIIANGFQADYICNLVKGLSEFCFVELIGSTMYMNYSFNSNVKLLNLRGDHDENVLIYMKGFRILRYYSKLISYLFKSKIKVIHIQWLRFYLVDGIIITLLARSLGKRVFYTAHDIIPYNYNTRVIRLLFKAIYRSQNIIITHTEFIRSRLIEEFKLPASRIQCVKHGVYESMDTPEIDFKYARNRLEINENDFVILFFGIIKKYKGLELILKAFNELREEADHVKLIIAGKISKDYKKEYHQIISSFKLDDTIIIPRFIEENEIEVLFKATNITVLPYSQASQSGVLFLSYAYGVPVVGPDLGGFPNDIKVGKTGLLFFPENKGSLLQNLIIAKQEFGGSRNRRRHYIKQFAIRYYSWKSSCKMLCTLYQKSDGDN